MHLAKKDLKYEAVWICEEVDHCTWRITDSFMGIWEIMWFIISSAFTNSVIWQDRHLLVTVYLKIDFRGAVFACWSCSFSVEERDFIRVSSVMNMWWRITGASRHNNKIFFFYFSSWDSKWKEWSHVQQWLVFMYVLAWLCGLSKH